MAISPKARARWAVWCVTAALSDVALRDAPAFTGTFAVCKPHLAVAPNGSVAATWAENGGNPRAERVGDRPEARDPPAADEAVREQVPGARELEIA